MFLQMLFSVLTWTKISFNDSNLKKCVTKIISITSMQEIAELRIKRNELEDILQRLEWCLRYILNGGCVEFFYC